MVVTLGMILFFYGLFGPLLNDVGILVLLPSHGSDLVLFNHTFNVGKEQYLPSARFGFFIF